MKIDRAISSLRFVYPFLFSANEYRLRVKTIEQAVWQGRDRPLAVWRRLEFPSEDLLDHLGKYLNAPEGTAYLWELEAAALQSQHGLGSGFDWALHFPRGEARFEFEAINLTLFSVGVGFLCVSVKVGGQEISDWLDVLHYFRFVAGQRGVSVTARRRVGMDPTTGQTRYSEFFPVAAVDNRSSDGSLRTLVEVLKKVLETAGGDLWCRDVFIPGQLLAFAVLYLDDVPENKTGELLYRVRNLFHAGQEIRPSAEDLRLDNSALLPYAESQWFTFSLEGGAFAAFNAPETPFFRGTLPDHLRNQYFLLFLLALQQRFTLIMLSGEITRHWLDEEHPVGLEQRVARFQAVRRRLLEFTARGYFAQVMQQEHHHRCFRKWQDIFQIDRLYQEVSDEAREIHAYLLMNRTEALRNLAERQQEHIKGVERRLNLIGLVIGIPALAMSYLQVVGGIAAMKAALVGLGALAAGALLFGGLEYLAARRRPRAHEDDRPDRDGPNPARDSSQVEDSRF